MQMKPIAMELSHSPDQLLPNLSLTPHPWALCLCPSVSLILIRGFKPDAKMITESWGGYFSFDLKLWCQGISLLRIVFEVGLLERSLCIPDLDSWSWFLFPYEPLYSRAFLVIFGSNLCSFLATDLWALASANQRVRLPTFKTETIVSCCCNITWKIVWCRDRCSR
jgi:hypothetical protein